MRQTIYETSLIFEGDEGNTLIKVSLYEEKNHKPVVVVREDPRNVGPKLTVLLFEDVAKEISTAMKVYAQGLEARERTETGKKVVLSVEIGGPSNTIWIHERGEIQERVLMREIGNHFHQTGRDVMPDKDFEKLITSHYQEPNRIGGHDWNLNKEALQEALEKVPNVTRERHIPQGQILQAGNDHDQERD